MGIRNIDPALITTLLPSRYGFFFIVLLTLVYSPCLTYALSSTDYEELNLRICTQNLQQWGTPPDQVGNSFLTKYERNLLQNNSRRRKAPQKQSFLKKKEKHLISRMIAARCDIIAVQEVFGNDSKEALIHLQQLAKSLATASERKFDAYIGDSLMHPLHVGFLVAEDRLFVQKVFRFDDAPLPKLQPLSRPLYFRRNPLGILVRPQVQGSTKGGGRDLQRSSEPAQQKCLSESSPQQFLLVTAHFKSKVDGWKDPTGTQFEVMRMEMAEGLRQLIAKEIEKLGNATTVIALGDWNSPPESAAEQILSGVKRLADFSSHGGCSVNEKLEPACPLTVNHPAVLVGLFGNQNLGQDGNKPGIAHAAQSTAGSYKYQGKLTFIDQIFVQPKDYLYFTRDHGFPDIGIEGVFNKGSDHKLLWASLHRCQNKGLSSITPGKILFNHRGHGGTQRGKH